MDDVRSRDFVDKPGLSDQDKRKMESVVDSFLTRAYDHAAYMRRFPGVMRMFYDVAQWHRNVVVENWYAHSLIDYDVYINDASWEVAHIILNKALKAVSPLEVFPPPVVVANQAAAMDTPYKVTLAAHPRLSGYLSGEGLAKTLYKLWVYFYEHRDRYKTNVEWHVETTSKWNSDLVAEVRVVRGVK